MSIYTGLRGNSIPLAGPLVIYEEKFGIRGHPPLEEWTQVTDAVRKEEAIEGVLLLL